MLSNLRTTFFLSFSVAVFAQNPPAPVRAALDFRTIPRPPVPADALELVTGEAQPVQDAQQRIAAISLPEHGARPVQCTRAALRPEDNFFHHGGPGSGWELDARRYGPRACLPLDGRRPELFGNQSLSGLHGKRPVRKSAQRHPAASPDAGPGCDFLYVSYGGSAGFGQDGNWLVEWCGTAVPADRDWRGQSFLRGQRNGRSRNTVSMHRADSSRHILRCQACSFDMTTSSAIRFHNKSITDSVPHLGKWANGGGSPDDQRDRSARVHGRHVQSRRPQGAGGWAGDESGLQYADRHARARTAFPRLE